MIVHISITIFGKIFYIGNFYIWQAMETKVKSIGDLLFLIMSLMYLHYRSMQTIMLVRKRK